MKTLKERIGMSASDLVLLVLVGAVFIACGLFLAYWLVQFIQWFFSFWPMLAGVLSWLIWGLVGFIIPAVLAAEVCDEGK